MRWTTLPILALGLCGSALAAAAPADFGVVTLDGKPMPLRQAYLFRAPDQFDDQRVNAVVVLTSEPLAKADLDAAKTLADIYAKAKNGVVLEIGPDKSIHMTVRHPGFGDLQYSSSPDDGNVAVYEKGHVVGSAKSFGSAPETIFGKYKIQYQLRFDVQPLLREFKTRK